MNTQAMPKDVPARPLFEVTTRKRLAILVSLVVACVLALSAKQAAAQPAGFFTDIRQLGINSLNLDLGPNLSADELTLYFNSSRAGSRDIYSATRTTPEDPFLPENVQAAASINTSSFTEGGACVSEDELELLFYSDRPVDDFGTRSFGAEDLFMARRSRTNEAFGNVENLGAGVNTTSADAGGTISPDGLVLVFRSDRPGGFGQNDLYLATRDSRDQRFTDPRNLGSEVNTESWELGAELSPDGDVLFFGRGSPTRSGNVDLYMAQRSMDGNGFTRVTRLSAPVNAPSALDVGPDVSWDWPQQGSKMFFASSRRSTFDFDIDLFEATWVSLDECVVENEALDVDCDGNGLNDACETEKGFASDINENGTPDSCDPNCNGNQWPDDYEIANSLTPDCNGNGVPDECDISSGAFPDDNANGVPDECDPRFIRGECNDDGAVNLADALCSLNWLFSDGTRPGCIAALNTNGDDSVNIADAIVLLSFLFANGAAPGAPFPECGPGTLPADSDLGCAATPASCR